MNTVFLEGVSRRRRPWTNVVFRAPIRDGDGFMSKDEVFKTVAEFYYSEIQAPEAVVRPPVRSDHRSLSSIDPAVGCVLPIASPRQPCRGPRERTNAPDAPTRRTLQSWAEGGAGLLLTGNVMVDPRARWRAPIWDLETHARFRSSASGRAATDCGVHIWMQLNHPGGNPRAGSGRARRAIPHTPETRGARLRETPRAP